MRICRYSCDVPLPRPPLPHLSKHGLLVANTLSIKDIKESAYFTHAGIARQFSGVFTLTLPRLHNVVGVFVKQQSSGAQLRQRLRSIPGLAHLKGRNDLPFRIAKLA